MIEQIKAELSKGGYSADDDVALTELKAVSTVNAGCLTAGGKIKLLSLAPTLMQRLENGVTTHAANDYTWGGIPTTIGAICNAGLKNLQSEAVDLDMSDPQTAQMIDILIAEGVATASDKSIIEFLSNDTVYPFSSATLREVKRARNKSNTEFIAWHGERYLTIEIDAVLPEKIHPLITVTNDVFYNEPIGRTVAMQEMGKYTVDLTGIGNKVVGETLLNVELWFDSVNVTLSVV